MAAMMLQACKSSIYEYAALTYRDGDATVCNSLIKEQIIFNTRTFNTFWYIVQNSIFFGVGYNVSVTERDFKIGLRTKMNRFEIFLCTYPCTKRQRRS